MSTSGASLSPGQIRNPAEYIVGFLCRGRGPTQKSTRSISGSKRWQGGIESMTQTDYILRMIEQMGQILVALRKMILQQSSPAQVISARLAAVASQSGFDLTLARAATFETIEMLVAPEGDLDPTRCWLVAEVLCLDGLQAQLEGRTEAAEVSFRKSLPLYALLKPKGLFLGLPEAAVRMSEVEVRLMTLDEQRAKSAPLPQA